MAFAFWTASPPCFNAAADGGSQSGYQRLIATPQWAMAQPGSLLPTSAKAFTAAPYQKEWSRATARSNEGCTSALHEVAKWTVPSWSGLPSARGCGWLWASVPDPPIQTTRITDTMKCTAIHRFIVMAPFLRVLSSALPPDRRGVGSSVYPKGPESTVARRGRSLSAPEAPVKVGVLQHTRCQTVRPERRATIPRSLRRVEAWAHSCGHGFFGNSARAIWRLAGPPEWRDGAAGADYSRVSSTGSPRQCRPTSS